MAIKLPNIEINFKQLAGTLIERSERGIAVLIVKDDTNTSFSLKQYYDITGLNADKELYTENNVKYIEDALQFALNKVYVVRIDTDAQIADALTIIEKNISTAWITVAEGTQEDHNALASWIKTKESQRKTYKAVTYKATTTDCKHIVNFCNEKVTFKDDRGEVTGNKYCSSLAAILAACNIKRSSTYFKCTNLERVVEVENSDSAVGEGKFILINDVDTVKIALGINSMTTADGINNTEDMKFIDTVEAMDLIQDDIANVFKNEYLGNYKNKYDNQVLLISAINTYLEALADNDILDSAYNNRADVDVETQRQAWIGAGKKEAIKWTEQQVKNNAFKRSVFLAGNIKILGAMENLKFGISLF